MNTAWTTGLTKSFSACVDLLYTRYVGSGSSTLVVEILLAGANTTSVCGTGSSSATIDGASYDVQYTTGLICITLSTFSTNYSGILSLKSINEYLFARSKLLTTDVFTNF